MRNLPAPLAAALLVAALLVAGSPPAEATIMRQLDLDTLVSTADLIALATVGEQTAEKRGVRIVTRVELRPERVMKGAAEGPVMVEVMGGTVDGIGQKVAGTARFTAGEQVIVFLVRLPEGDGWRVRGMAQGKLSVVPGLGGGRVVRDLSGLRLVETGPDGEVKGEGTAVESMPLDAFLRDLAVRIARDAPPVEPVRLEPGTPPTDTLRGR